MGLFVERSILEIPGLNVDAKVEMRVQVVWVHADTELVRIVGCHPEAASSISRSRILVTKVHRQLKLL